MKESKKDKTIKISATQKSLIIVIVLLVVAPLFINVGLLIMDFIYYKFNIVLTAKGLNNEIWLEFWKDYLSVAIAFFGIYLVWDSANKDRKRQSNKDASEQYLAHLSAEERTLVEVSQCFNIGIVYKALNQLSNATIQNSKMILEDSRDRMDEAHVKFELLTDLSDDFERCKQCKYNSCVDKRIKREIRDMFYDMEKHYLDMLDMGEECLNKIAVEQYNLEMIDTHVRLIDNLKQQIANMRKIDCDSEQISYLEKELANAERKLQNISDAKLSKEAIDEMIKPIHEEASYLVQTMRPKFNRYCKSYIDLKRNHASDLRNDGFIKYIKENDMIQ